MLVIQVSKDGIARVREALTGTTAEAVAASLPAGSGLWCVPEAGEAAVRRDLTGIPEVDRGLRLAASMALRTDPPALLRPWLARRLFDDWNPTTNPELRGAQWNKMCADDRAFWIDRAQQYLSLTAGKEV